MPSSRLLSPRLSSLLLPLLLAACSGGDSDTGGDAGAGGSGGAGAGGAAGKTSAGAAGSTSAGAAGSTAGAAGKATGGAAGSTSAGSSGTSGQSGATGAIPCDVANDCAGFLPATKPVSCAKAVCDADSHRCRFVARDLDSDGDPSNSCQSLTAGITIELGGDCDDTDDTVHTGAWDGPKGKYKGEDQLNRCDDGADNDCNGKVDDGALDDGTTCKCTPGDVRKCSADSAGKPITFPGGTPQGLCTFGNQTCSDKGKWGECTGAVGPAAEECNGKDDDCDGETDETSDVLNPPTWTCDQDGDNHAAPDAKTLKQCSQPSEECGANGQWVTSKLPADDCDDSNAAIFPGAPEICNGLDNNCVNGITDEVTTTYYCDGDVDGYTTDSVKPVTSCGPPATGTNSCAGVWRDAKTSNDCNDGNGSIHPGASEVCNGIDDNCTGGIDDVPGIGNKCNAAGLSVGACLGGGKIACSNNAPTCLWSEIGPSAGFHDTASGNGSWDWNCDGIEEREAVGCSNFKDESSCNGKTTYSSLGVPAPKCGEVFTPCKCFWSSFDKKCTAPINCFDPQRVHKCR